MAKYEQFQLFAMNSTSSLSSGRTVIPAAVREQFGIKDGDQLIWSVRGDELVVTTRRAQLRRAQEMVRKYIPAGVSLVDELLADRKAEQAKDGVR